MKKLVLLAILMLSASAFALFPGWGGTVGMGWVDDFTVDTNTWGWTPTQEGIVNFNVTDTTARDGKALRFRNDSDYQALLNVYVGGATAGAKVEASEVIKPGTVGIWHFNNYMVGPVQFKMEALWDGVKRGIQIIDTVNGGDILGGAYIWWLEGADFWQTNVKYTYVVQDVAGGIQVDILGPAGSIIGGPKTKLGTSLIDIYGGFGITINTVNSDSSSPRNFDYVQVTPEPATIALLAIGGLALLKRKKA